MKRDANSNQPPAVAETGRREDRREWLTSVARRGLLGGLVVMVGYLVGRRVKNGCPETSGRCRSCRWLSQCDLPDARSVRGEVDSRSSGGSRGRQHG